MQLLAVLGESSAIDFVIVEASFQIERAVAEQRNFGAGFIGKRFPGSGFSGLGFSGLGFPGSGFHGPDLVP